MAPYPLSLPSLLTGVLSPFRTRRYSSLTNSKEFIWLLMFMALEKNWTLAPRSIEQYSLLRGVSGVWPTTSSSCYNDERLAAAAATSSSGSSGSSGHDEQWQQRQRRQRRQRQRRQRRLWDVVVCHVYVLSAVILLVLERVYVLQPACVSPVTVRY